LNAFIIQIVETAFTVLVWLIIGRCILSFIRHDPYHPIIKFIYEVTEPVMSPFRRLLPPAGGLD
jgi:YggT family protein